MVDGQIGGIPYELLFVGAVVVITVGLGFMARSPAISGHKGKMGPQAAAGHGLPGHLAPKV